MCPTTATRRALHHIVTKMVTLARSRACSHLATRAVSGKKRFRSPMLLHLSHTPLTHATLTPGHTTTLYWALFTASAQAAEKIPLTDLYGEYNGNGCCCTPACDKVKVSENTCCKDGVCIASKCCGVGPYMCPIPLTPSPCDGPNVYCFTNGCKGHHLSNQSRQPHVRTR